LRLPIFLFDGINVGLEGGAAMNDMPVACQNRA